MKKLVEKLQEKSSIVLKAFRSGGGLRILRLENKVKNNLLAYGEAPTFNVALQHLEEDLEVDGRIYEDTYGKIYPHYLTGTSEASSNIDCWLLMGRSFDIYYDHMSDFHFKSKFLHDVNYKFKEKYDYVYKTKKALTFEVDGIIYCCEPSYFPSGEACTNCKVIENRSGLDPWMREFEIEYKSGRLTELFEEVERKLNYWLKKED